MTYLTTDLIQVPEVSRRDRSTIYGLQCCVCAHETKVPTSWVETGWLRLSVSCPDCSHESCDGCLRWVSSAIDVFEELLEERQTLQEEMDLIELMEEVADLDDMVDEATQLEELVHLSTRGG